MVNGSFVVEERIGGGGMRGEHRYWNHGWGGLWSRVDVLTAPQGKLDALVRLVHSNNLPHGVVDPQWGQAFLQRQQQQGNAMLAKLAAQEKAESNMIYQQFQQIMATSQAEHQAFMQQQESQFQSAMNNAILNERADDGGFGLGGLCAGSTDGDWSGRDGESIERILAEPGRTDRAVVPNQRSEYESERNAFREWDAGYESSWERAVVWSSC